MIRPEATDNLPLSKTKKKQLAKEIEKLAHRLVALPQPQFNRLPLDDAIAAEAAEARATEGRGAHKRQVKYLAGLLREREADIPLLLAALENLDQVKRTDKRVFHQLEKIRDQLCDSATFDEAFARMVLLWPDLDHGGISRLAHSVHDHGDKKAYREIFRRLRKAAENTGEK